MVDISRSAAPAAVASVVSGVATAWPPGGWQATAAISNTSVNGLISAPEIWSHPKYGWASANDDRRYVLRRYRLIERRDICRHDDLQLVQLCLEQSRHQLEHLIRLFRGRRIGAPDYPRHTRDPVVEPDGIVERVLPRLVLRLVNRLLDHSQARLERVRPGVDARGPGLTLHARLHAVQLADEVADLLHRVVGLRKPVADPDQEIELLLEIRRRDRHPRVFLHLEGLRCGPRCRMEPDRVGAGHGHRTAGAPTPQDHALE